jgi:hypothetical protein
LSREARLRIAMEGIEEARQLREQYEAATDEAEARRAAYHRAVQKLHMSGVPLREIAEALGLSHQRVHQIVGGAPREGGRSRRAKGILAAIVLAAGIGGGWGTWHAIAEQPGDFHVYRDGRLFWNEIPSAVDQLNGP